MAIPQDGSGNLGVNPVMPTGALSTMIQGTATAGAVATQNPINNGVIADGANAGTATIKSWVADAAAAGRVCTEGKKATYSSAFQVTVYTSATDIAQLLGSATTIVRLTRVSIAGIATTVGVIDVIGIRRSAANAGGTITGQNVSKHDSTNAVAAAVPSSITVNPTTLGTSANNVRFGKVGLQTATGSVTPVPLVWTFTERNEQGLTLRGVSEQFSVNMNGTQQAGQVMNIEMSWTEE